MNRAKSLLCALFLVPACSTGNAATSAPNPRDEAPLERLMQAHDAAWNDHDPALATALFAPDATVVTPQGRRVQGQPALREMFASPGPTKQTRSATHIDAVQWIADDLAIVDATQSLTGPGVEVIGASEATLVGVVQRIDGQWRFVAARPHARPATATP